MRVRLLNIHPQRAIIYFPKRVEFFHDPFLPDGERERNGGGRGEGRGGEGSVSKRTIYRKSSSCQKL